VVELNAELTPDHVRNIHDLLRRPSPRDGKRGFYRGLSWHRVVSHFVVQGGCPRGDGWGDPGWTLPDELTDLPFLRGALGMPKAGPDTGGCQLFFCHAPTPHLDGRYTLFGYVRSGFETVDLLEEGDLILGVSVIAKGGRHGH